jgi:outer membrane protein
MVHAGRVLLLITVTLVSSSLMASAQSAITLPPPPFWPSFLPSLAGVWTVTIGANGNVQPDFEGAKQYRASASPIFSPHRPGSRQFDGPRDNVGFALFEWGGFSAGPVGKLTSARTASRDAALNGLGDVGTAIELGGFAEYFPVDWLRARAELRQGFGGHHGVVADFSADVIVPIMQRVTWSGGPRFTWEDTRATAPYFGITAAQAAASGLPAFDAKGGAHAVGAGTQVRFQIDPHWEVHSYVEYDRLLGSAAASPLVALRGSPDQVRVGLGASYSFDVRVAGAP